MKNPFKKASVKTPPLPLPDRFSTRYPFWALLLCGLAIDLLVETLCRHSLLDALRFVLRAPHLFLYNALIISLTYSFATVFPRRAAALVCASVIWVGLGLIDFVVTLFRTTPLSFADFVLLPYVKSIVTYYVNVWLLIPLLILLAAALSLLLIRLTRCQRYVVSLRHALCLPAYALIVIALTIFLTQTRRLPDHYENLINAYKDNGFVYCFLRSLIDQGIDEPAYYSDDQVEDSLEKIVQDDAMGGSARPNVVFVQLESFFDPRQLIGLKSQEDYLPNFTALRDKCPSGYLTVPVFGGGTVNAEFEVLTGMSVRDFGTGEFPYHTVLQDMCCESICYNLKELGYTAHAIHNYTAIFYNRFKIFANLGFDTFTSIEYMNGVRYNPIGWARDEVLVDYVIEALDATATPDFVQTITVQPHGSYPDDNPGEPIAIESDGFSSEESRRAFSYYISQIREEDAFIGQLTQALSQRREPTLVVFYGDHLPNFALTDDMLAQGSIYQTEYVIWSNYGLKRPDRDLNAWQLSAYVMDILGFDNGLLTKLHQYYLDQPQTDYSETLQLIEYDMLYGEQSVYEHGYPYQPTNLRMGLSEIAITSLRVGEKTLSVYGTHFTEHSAVLVNGERQYTEFVSPTELISLVSLDEGDVVCVAQLSNGEPISATASVSCPLP